MLRHLRIDKPLVIFDLETTGTDPKSDRIIEISTLKIEPDGSRDHRTRRINLGVPIPAAASAVHGIYDQDVADCPSFGKYAKGIADFIGEADLCGFNMLRFDLKMLASEFDWYSSTKYLPSYLIFCWLKS